MKHVLFYLVVIYCFPGCKAQRTFGTEYLKLEKVIEMPGVRGRIDHIAINLKARVIYVAALGNNSVEVIDLQKGAVIHSIKGLNEPQGVAYLPEHNEIIIANGGNGNCGFYDAGTYAIIATLHLTGDADNARYNAYSGKIYVGYGDGGIAVIDAGTHRQTGDIELSAHPESFQIDQKNNVLVVNLPDANSIAMIDLSDLKVISTWKTNHLRANFSMALDTASNLVMIGYRRPSALVVYDVKTGKEFSRADLVSDVDDIFYYESKQQVFASGGGGSVNVYKKVNNALKLIANITTTTGARTSLLVPQLNLFLVAEPSVYPNDAKLLVYKIQK